jgi:hypothetical protein
MNLLLGGRIERIFEHNLELYRYRFVAQENGLAWFSLYRKINGLLVVHSLNYRNPKNLPSREVERAELALRLEISEDGAEKAMEKTGPMAFFLHNFDRLFQNSMTEKEDILDFVLSAFQKFDDTQEFADVHWQSGL